MMPRGRQTIDALHCGRRLYLHDDLQAVSVSESLIAAPPIELWPRLVTRVPVPQDLERGLSALHKKRDA